MSDEQLDVEILKQAKKRLRPNHYLADLYREKIRRLGYGIEDKQNGTRIYKL